MICFLLLPKGYYFHFDPKFNADARLKDSGDFNSHSNRYQDVAKLPIALAAGAIAFLVNTLTSPADTHPNPYKQNLLQVAPIVVGFFGCCIAFLMLFMLSQAWFYEQYSHSATHSTYTRPKYALSMSLGFSGFISFLLAFVWLAANLFR